MGNDICWIVTVLSGNALVKCALKVERNALTEECDKYPLEPENRKSIHEMLPLHVQCGQVVAVEPLFEVHIANNSSVSGPASGKEKRR